MNRSVGMDNLLVPGRHAPMSLLFTRIPVGRDITFDAAEDDKHLIAVAYLAPDGIATRHMRQQHVAIQKKWKVVGLQTGGSVCHQHAQRVLADDAVKLPNPGLGELCR